eukprot:7387062-Prymnesium_polylepis.2
MMGEGARKDSGMSPTAAIMQRSVPTPERMRGEMSLHSGYAGRMVFTGFNDSPADPTDMLPGDLLMVHKTKDCLGRNTNRASKSATWRQINAVLGKTARIGGTVLGPGMDQAMVDARLFAEEGLLTARDFTEHDALEMTWPPPGPAPAGRGVELRSRSQDISTEYNDQSRGYYEYVPVTVPSCVLSAEFGCDPRVQSACELVSGRERETDTRLINFGGWNPADEAEDHAVVTYLVLEAPQSRVAVAREQRAMAAARRLAGWLPRRRATAPPLQ